MGYGLSFSNASGRILIDSDQGFPTLYQTADSTVSGGTAFPSTTDLVFAKPTATSGTSQLYKDYNGNFICTSGTLNYRQFRSVVDGGFTQATSGHGLNVFNATNCIFSATSANYTSSMDILAVGFWGFGASTTLEIPMPNATYALSSGKIYVCMNSTHGVAGGVQYTYTYLFSTGTHGTIRLTSQTATSSGGGNTFIIGFLRE
jgi:hypothetical protein